MGSHVPRGKFPRLPHLPSSPKASRAQHALRAPLRDAKPHARFPTALRDEVLIPLFRGKRSANTSRQWVLLKPAKPFGSSYPLPVMVS